MVEGECVTISFHEELVLHDEGVAFGDGSVVFPRDMVQFVDFDKGALSVTTNCTFFDQREYWMIQWSPYFATQIPAQKIKDIAVL
ncbi:MAG: hypothetical protein HZA35_03860 [Parcubacteria group bacterium]|nr:hypothetical protein [Parcubacteria group bacterium]